MNFDDEIESALRDRLEDLRARPLARPAIDRTRRRRVASLARTTLVAVAAVASGAWVVTATIPDRTPSDVSPAAPAPSSPAPETTATPQAVDPAPKQSCDEGLWSRDCPEAAWVTAVADEAGLPVMGDTGTAFEVGLPGESLYVWATSPDEAEDRRPVLEAEGYQSHGPVSGIEVFGDGERLTWEIHGLYVWASGADSADIRPSTSGVGELVAASKAVAWPRQ